MRAQFWEKPRPVASSLQTPNKPRSTTMIGSEVLTSLFDEHAAALVLYARQWTVLPEDVVQEALVQLFRQEVLPSDPVAWLFRVVRNGAISQARQQSRRRSREAATARARDPWFCDSSDGRLAAEEATEALRRLPTEERETVVARLWGGLSFEQVGQLTGVSTSTAHRRYAAGLTTLRRLMSETEPTTAPAPER
jgi:RNA polymerase sigma-70 factor (ECF subfamily)